MEEMAPGWRGHVHRCSTRLYGPSAAMTSLSWIGDERIAVGSVPTARSVRLLASQGVTHIVNCRARAETYFSQDLAVERALFGRENVAHAPMWDSGRRQPSRLWAAAARFATQSLNEEPQARVFIHCHQGRRRSALLAYAVLRLRGHTADNAARLICDHRVEAQLVPAYIDSVEHWLSSDSSAPSL